MRTPVPNAPPGYDEPIWRHDDIDALIIVDRSAEDFPPLTSGVEPSHPVDRFVTELSRELNSLLNISNVLLTTAEVTYMEDLPTAMYAVVTNSKLYADWWRAEGANLIEIEHDDAKVVLRSRGESLTAEPGDRIGREFAESAIQYSPEEPTDSGASLLDPISSREVATIEPLLGELWSAMDQNSLSEIHQAQILAMAELIKAAQLETVPGETQRWKLVGTVRAALRYLAKEVPRDALAWWKLVELLNDVDWTTIASELPKL